MMSTQDQISRLQSLLGRVQKNASRPRVTATASPAAVAPAPAPVEELVAMPEPELIPEPAPLAEPFMAQAEPVPEETSMVRAIEAPADDEEVSVEMGESSMEDLDLLEDDIVDITDPSEEDTIDASADAEEPPASSRRPIAGSMGEALAGAAEAVELDEGREIPLKTPPPESGPQVAPPPQGLAAPAVPELGDIRAVGLGARAQPTAAQLGSTVDLEPAGDAELELGEPVAEAPPVHLVREEAPRPEAVQPEVFQRPSIATAAPAGAFVSAARTFQPASFSELLDASLALGLD
jgi:hypothetical protein